MWLTPLPPLNHHVIYGRSRTVWAVRCNVDGRWWPSRPNHAVSDSIRITTLDFFLTFAAINFCEPFFLNALQHQRLSVGPLTKNFFYLDIIPRGILFQKISRYTVRYDTSYPDVHQLGSLEMARKKCCTLEQP